MVRTCGYYWSRNNKKKMRDKYLYSDLGGKRNEILISIEARFLRGGVLSSTNK